MSHQQEPAQAFLSIPKSQQFKGTVLRGIFPTLQCVNKAIKWNHEIISFIDTCITKIKEQKLGCTTILKVTMKGQWGNAILSNFVNNQIDQICVHALEQQRRRVVNHLNCLQKWSTDQSLKPQGQFLRNIFNFYTMKYGEEFKNIGRNIQQKIEQIHPGHQFYKTLNFSISDVLIANIEKSRYDLTLPYKSSQLKFNEQNCAGSFPLYGLNQQNNTLINLYKQKQQINIQIKQLKKSTKFSSEQLLNILQLYCKILSQKQDSIRNLNSLISNEEEQLSYRQNQVQILSLQIKKMLSQHGNIAELKEKVQFLQKQVKTKERSIIQLNKLISNEEEQLIYRENQVETLNEEIKKLLKFKQQILKQNK